MFAWGEEHTQEELFEVAHEFGDPNLKAVPVRPLTFFIGHLHSVDHTAQMSPEDIGILLQKAKEPDWDGTPLPLVEYHYNMWVLGENTVESAKKEECGGALDAQELYPDLKVKTLREIAPAYYGPFKSQ